MNIVYSLITVLCLVILILESLIVIINVALKKRSQRIAFLRGFKKGKCAIIYITAIPLYCIGHMYAGRDFLGAFFDAVNKIVSLVVLKYETGSIRDLMLVDPVYNFTIYFCFIMVGINALILTFSLVNQYIWCAIQETKAMILRKDKLFIFGNNAENISVYLSDKSRTKVIVDDMSDKDSERLYIKNVSFISTHSHDGIIAKIFRTALKSKKEHIIVVNTRDDEKNITICRTIINSIDRASEDAKKHLFSNTRIFVFGDPRHKAIYEDIVSSGFGCIHYVNKYLKVAIDFVDKYPFSRFMDGDQIDFETSLIKDGVDINVMLVGFGNSARQMFLTSVANNQFLKSGNDGPELKKVKYFVFDKEDAENNKNLNHDYYRYKYECSELDPEDYLPLPTQPAQEEYYKLDINDREFYNRIRSVATKGRQDANFIIIAFGSDLENMDMAQKLVEKRKEWEIENLVIFVKARAWRKEQTLLENEGCYFIGNENDVVYNIDRILNDQLFRMAQMRNEVYDLEYTISGTPGMVVDDEIIKKNHESSYRKWYMVKSQMERESSVYCCLSLRSKLNLMGLDYCEATGNDKVGLSEEEYLAIYAGDDKPDTSRYNVKANGKPIVSYTLDFKESRRKTMAIHEHQRWNSFMISKGIIPSSREQIKSERVVDENGRERYVNGKNYAARRHGNLTTFEGLVEFRRIVAARDNCSELEKDVIKYDYQLLDDAYWLLTSAGYKIIRGSESK